MGRGYDGSRLWYYRAVNFSASDLTWILTLVTVLLLSLSVHEWAHARTADYFGDQTARRMGRVTLNPIAHIDPVGTILFPILGFLMGGLIFGWAKPVPVNTANLHRPRLFHSLIALAGPASNLAIAALFVVILRFLGDSAASGFESGGWSGLRLVCQAGLLLNVILAVFNLVPIPPLDGSWILSHLLPNSLSRWFDEVRPYGFILLVLLLYTGLLSRILSPVVVFAFDLAG